MSVGVFHHKAFCSCGAIQFKVRRDEGKPTTGDHLRRTGGTGGSLRCQGSRQLDGIISAQTVCLRELIGMVKQLGSDLN